MRKPNEMNYYLDIEPMPDADFDLHSLIGILYEKIHLLLVQNKGVNIGISFPQKTDFSLGNTLRLHGSAADLSIPEKKDWQKGLRDYLKTGPVSQIPQTAKYRLVKRAQSKSNPARLRRRLMKRHSISEEEAVKRIPDSMEKFLELPFVMMRSSSSQQHFRLFLQHGPLLDSPVKGTFNTYGLSTTATIPWF